ncbi:hypothetical protein RF11_12158 [Thelohanellus kitauei]|uniref:Uncharacterized protein n=1 Tax=Thelohanellus kitauei TaxID=669202 RepID=A0A0C2ICA1_THEKT|nr:hypothetical protein RF11_12158 [Thelohanellus kitauei]
MMLVGTLFFLFILSQHSICEGIWLANDSYFGFLHLDSQGGSKFLESETSKDFREATGSKSQVVKDDSQQVHTSAVHESFFGEKVQDERRRDYVTAFTSFSSRNSLNVHHVRSDDDFYKTYHQASNNFSATFRGMVIVAVVLKIVGILVVVGIIGFVLWFFLVRRRTQAQQHYVLPSTPYDQHYDPRCYPARV